MADGLILIIDHSPDIAMLYRRTLQDEGFTVETGEDTRSPVQQVRHHEPALLVLDVLPYGERALEALDALRDDDHARDVPVVVTTTSREIAEAALASYNVRAALVKPFDLDELVTVAEREGGRLTMHADIPEDAAPSGGFVEYAEHVLSRRSRHLIFRWIQRLRQESPWGDRDDLRLADLIDHAPIVLKALDVRLHYDNPAGFFERHPEALERAKGHALLRSEQGIAFGATLREYALLREEIWIELRTAPPETVRPEDLFQVEQAINGTLDAIITATAAAFVGEPPPPGIERIPPSA